MSHGPDPCEDCGVFHTDVRMHFHESGTPVVDDATSAQWREVMFVGFDSSGRPLWTDAEETR